MVKNPASSKCYIGMRAPSPWTDLSTAEIDMAKSAIPDDVDVFLDNVTWTICSTYHTVLEASPGAAIFG
jgi:hypothetical protein